MFSAKQLSADQIASIREWAASGAQLPQIQLRIREEFGISVTYMDTRLLILDLGIELIEEVKNEPTIQPAETPVLTGMVTTTMDHVAIPGAMVSGKVIFSDGESAIWMLDQTGRPGLDPDTAGYRPTQEDIVEFQKQLRKLIEDAGL